MRETLIKNFLRISSIPRKSGNEKEISNFFVEVAKKNNLEYFQDKNYNVLIKKKGNIEGTPTILQAHFDMVCVKTNESIHDFNKDGIEVIIDNDKVTAKDTSLGADQGVGLTIMLTLMEDNSIKHPDLEFMFTVEEETTFKGTVEFPYDKLSGKNLINLDNCRDYDVVIGSAGDIVNEYVFNSILTEKNMPSYRITLDGYKSGNSGENIVDSEETALTAIAKLLKDKEVYIKSINGGTFENDLIPSCVVEIQTNLDVYSIFNNVKIEKINSTNSFSLEDTNNIINEILALKGGYISETASSNIGIISTNNNEIKIAYIIRSINKDELNRISNNTKLLNYNFKCNEVYTDTEWIPNNNSELLRKYKDTYYSIYNEYPKDTICQGGIESAFINKRTQGIDIIAIGATMDNIHSVNEVTYISSWEKIYNILIELLSNI